MSKYLVRVSFKPEGLRQVLTKAKGTGLRAAVAKLVEAAGGKLEAWYFAFGEDDVVAILDLPDNVAAASLSVAANAAGFINLSITPLLTPDEMDKAIEKSGGLPVPGRA
jgi:uncharacterized protein with GYD domain